MVRHAACLSVHLTYFGRRVNFDPGASFHHDLIVVVLINEFADAWLHFNWDLFRQLRVRVPFDLRLIVFYLGVHRVWQHRPFLGVVLSRLHISRPIFQSAVYRPV